MTEHDCMDYRERVPEGDVVIERCAICGLVRCEPHTGQPMRWFRQSGACPWPWRYAGTPAPSPDAPELWKPAASIL